MLVGPQRDVVFCAAVDLSAEALGDQPWYDGCEEVVPKVEVR